MLSITVWLWTLKPNTTRNATVRKFNFAWSGRHRITKIVNDVTFIVSQLFPGFRILHRQVNIGRLRPYTTPGLRPPLVYDAPVSKEDAEAELWLIQGAQILRRTPVEDRGIGRNTEMAKRFENAGLDDEIFEIDAVIDEHGEKTYPKFLVRWKGYDDRWNTWKPASEIPKVAIARYHECLSQEKRNLRDGQPRSVGSLKQRLSWVELHVWKKGECWYFISISPLSVSFCPLSVVLSFFWCRRLAMQDLLMPFCMFTRLFRVRCD